MSLSIHWTIGIFCQFQPNLLSQLTFNWCIDRIVNMMREIYGQFLFLYWVCWDKSKNSISHNVDVENSLSELPCYPSLAKYTTPCQIYFHFNGLPAPSDQWPHCNTGLWLVNEGNIGLWLVEGGTITRMWIQSSHEIGLTFIPQNICVYLDRGYITTKCKQPLHQNSRQQLDEISCLFKLFRHSQVKMKMPW